MFFIGVIQVDHLANFSQAETDPLAAQNPRQPRAVAPRIDAGQTLPFGRDQPLILIESQGTRRDAKLFGKVGNAVALLVPMVG